MTALSGDALSHANFQARADVVFDGGQLSRIRLRRSAFGAPAATSRFGVAGLVPPEFAWRA
jgi:hypothetical protein